MCTQDRFITAGSDWSADTGNVDSWGRQSGRASSDTECAVPADGCPERSLSTDLYAVSEALDESGEDHHSEAEQSPKEQSDRGSSEAPAPVSPVGLDVKPPAAPRNLSPGTSLESIQESEEQPETEEEHKRLLQAEDAIIEEEIERGGLSSTDEDDDVDDDASDAASDASSEALALAVAAHGSDLDEDIREQESRGGRGGASNRRSGGGGVLEKQGSVLAPSFSKGLTRLASLLPRRDGRGTGASGSGAHLGEAPRGAFPTMGCLRASFMGASSLPGQPRDESDGCACLQSPCTECPNLVTPNSIFLRRLAFTLLHADLS